MSKEIIEISGLNRNSEEICKIFFEPEQGWHIFNIDDFDYPEDYDFVEVLPAFDVSHFYTFDPEKRCTSGDNAFNLLIESTKNN